jgi:hypothetical protein
VSSVDPSPITIEVCPGDRPCEEVGVLGDGRQFLLTANLRPSSLGDDERRLLVLIVFDEAGVPDTVDVQSLGLRTEVSPEAVADAIAARLAQLGTSRCTPIQIRPIDPGVLGPLFAPLVVTSEEAPGLHITLSAGAIVPGWPFSSDD